MQVGEVRFDSEEIHGLYESDHCPLRRRTGLHLSDVDVLAQAEFIRAVDLGVLRQCVWPRQQSPPCYFFQDWPDYLAMDGGNLAKR